MVQDFCKLLAICAVSTVTATAASSDTVEVEAVFNASAQDRQVSALMPLDQFLSTGQEISEAGLRIFDVETVRVDGTRRYIGVWRPGGGFSRFIGPIGAIEFGDKVREMRADNRRLEDFEIFRTPTGGRRYLGLWRNGAGEEVITGPMQLEAFDARGTRLAEDGLSLVDLEVEILNGTELYHGLFRTEIGTTTNAFTSAQTRAAFIVERNARVADGWDLIDMETIEPDGGEVLYAGVWRKGGSGPSTVSALRELDDFRDFREDQLDAGRAPSDLELRRIVADGGVTPTPPPPADVTTDDLPDHPEWLSLNGRSGEVIVTFDPNSIPTEDGFRIEIDRQLLPVLPTKLDGQIVFPDNICGFRVFRPLSVQWTNLDGTEIEDGAHLSHPNFPVGSPEATAAMSGLDFTGPFGACEGSTENWRFMAPLHATSDGGPPFRRVIFELPDEVGFLNHTIPLENPFDSGVQPKDFFKPTISKLLEQIAKGFLNQGKENGYCSGVLDYMEGICGADAQDCPFDDLEDIDVTGGC